MTPQEIFNRVATRLHDGTGQAMVDGTCMYLDNAGNKCVVGIFMSDNTSTQNFVGGVYSLIKNYPNDIPPWFIDNAKLLEQLQEIHDSSDAWTFDGTLSDEGEVELELCAAKHLLELPAQAGQVRGASQ